MKFFGRLLATVATSVFALGGASATVHATAVTEVDRHPVPAHADLPLIAAWTSALEGGRLEDIAGFVMHYPESEYSALAYEILESDTREANQNRTEARNLGWIPPEAAQVPVGSLLFTI